VVVKIRSPQLTSPRIIQAASYLVRALINQQSDCHCQRVDLSTNRLATHQAKPKHAVFTKFLPITCKQLCYITQVVVENFLV